MRRHILTLDPEARSLPAGPVTCQIDYSLPTAALERCSGNVRARAMTAIEHELIVIGSRHIANPRRQLRERNVYGARNVTCGKLALGANVENMQRVAAIDAYEELRGRGRRGRIGNTR
jgi:hypothetical protein